LRQDIVAEEQRVAIVPQETGGVVEAVLLDLLAEVGPAGPPTPADVIFSVVPPKLEAAGGVTTDVPDAQNVIVGQKLLDVQFIVHGDLSHGSILHEKVLSESFK
jgi:hypothetical protein